MTTIYATRRGVRKSETVIDRAKLATLEIMARRGEAYEAAAKRMRNRQADMIEKQREAHLAGDASKVQWCAGWLAAIRDFSEEVLRRDE